MNSCNLFLSDNFDELSSLEVSKDDKILTNVEIKKFDVKIKRKEMKKAELAAKHRLNQNFMKEQSTFENIGEVNVPTKAYKRKLTNKKTDTENGEY